MHLSGLLNSVTIIGGADGPTSVFLAGKTGGSPLWLIAVVIILAVIIAMIIVARRK